MTPKSNVVRLRLTELEHESWAAAAGGKGKLSSWIRATCNAATINDLAAKHPAGIDPPYEIHARSLGLPVGKTKREEKKEAETTLVASSDCPRWMHHRKGTYCGSCKRVV